MISNEKVVIKKVDRNKIIVERFNSNISSFDISKEFNITETRVRQILKPYMTDELKNEKNLKLFIELKEDVNNGISFKDIKSKYGISFVNYCKKSCSYNVFKHTIEHTEKDIIKMYKKGKSPLVISEKHDLDRNYVYTILHSNGYRKNLSVKKRKKRDEKIIQLKHEGKSIKELSTKYKLTETMIRIIINSNKTII